MFFLTTFIINPLPNTRNTYAVEQYTALFFFLNLVSHQKQGGLLARQTKHNIWAGKLGNITKITV